jgi:hypothetical protein
VNPLATAIEVVVSVSVLVVVSNTYESVPLRTSDPEAAKLAGLMYPARQGVVTKRMSVASVADDSRAKGKKRINQYSFFEAVQGTIP